MSNTFGQYGRKNLTFILHRTAKHLELVIFAVRFVDDGCDEGIEGGLNFVTKGPFFFLMFSILIYLRNFINIFSCVYIICNNI